MSAETNSNWLISSLTLKFITNPFRIIIVLFAICSIVFGLSIITQTYFHQENLLSKEISNLENMGNEPIFDIFNTNKKPINIVVSQKIYSAASVIFYEWIPIRKVLTEENPSDTEIKFRTYLLNHQDLLSHFDSTLKVISIRIGNLSLYVIFIIFLSIVAITDGLVQRSIRKKNAGRESAGIYHRAKYWRVGFTWSCIMFYLAMPFAIPIALLAVPAMFNAGMSYLQFKYLKKYL